MAELQSIRYRMGIAEQDRKHDTRSLRTKLLFEDGGRSGAIRFARGPLDQPIEKGTAELLVKRVVNAVSRFSIDYVCPAIGGNTPESVRKAQVTTHPLLRWDFLRANLAFGHSTQPPLLCCRPSTNSMDKKGAGRLSAQPPIQPSISKA